MNKQLSSHQFKDVYKWLGIDLNKLGCLMLDTEPLYLPSHIIYDWETGAGVNFDKFFLDLFMYKSLNPDRFWINGLVSDNVPHITLLYGLLSEAKNYKPHIEEVLLGWNLETVKIADIGFPPLGS